MVNKIIKYLLPVFLCFIVFVSFFSREDNLYEPPSVPLLEEYLRSQDINFDVENRIHISDSHIYYASGVLYLLGSDPTTYNFQHPPLVKYLFGYSGILFGSPYFVQLLFSIVLVILIYVIGVKVHSVFAGLIASTLLIIDPLFISLQSQSLLDLGLASFIVLFIYVSLFFPKKVLFQSIALAAAAGSKFWTTAVFALGMVFLFEVYKLKSIPIKKYVKLSLISGILFSLLYIGSFLTHGLAFNIFFWQAKMAKFMITHDAATELGGAIRLFLMGEYESWWGMGTQQADVWSPVWPVVFFVTLGFLLLRRKLEHVDFLGWFGILYLIFISKGVPFTRYFIVILPFFYVVASVGIIVLLERFGKSYHLRLEGRLSHLDYWLRSKVLRQDPQ